MKFSRTFTNKLISYVDRYFTYDSRTMRREGTDAVFDFFAVYTDNGVKTTVVVDRLKPNMLWVSIAKNDIYVHSGFIHSYKDADNFKKMVRCLG